MEVLNINDYKLVIRCTGHNNGDGGCNSLLEIDNNDLYVTVKALKIDEDKLVYTFPNYCYTFRCPCCKIETDISEDSIPFSLRKIMLKKYREDIVCKLGKEKKYE